MYSVFCVIILCMSYNVTKNVVLGFLASMAMGVSVAAESPLKPYALLIMFDGFRADMVRIADMPALRSLMAGRWHPDYRCAWSLSGQNLDDAMTYSYANHASIITGVTRAKHNVAFNCDVYDGLYVRWPSWQTRIARAIPGARGFFATDWEPPIGKDKTTIDWCENPSVTVAADKLVKRLAVSDGTRTFSFFVGMPDHAGHESGYFPTGDAYLAACRTNDLCLARILDAVRSRPTFAQEDWLIMLTSDHGGIHYMHGQMDAQTRTVPIVLCGRRVVQGPLAGLPRTYDVPCTALAHFGIDPTTCDLDGEVIGGKPSPVRSGSLAEAMALCFPFTDELAGTMRNSTRNALPDGWKPARAGDPTYINCAKEGGICGKCLSINGEAGCVNAMSFPETARGFAGSDGAFTFAFWINAEKEPKNAEIQPVFGNMDLDNPNSPGFQVVTQFRQPRCQPGICLLYRQASGVRNVVGPFFPDSPKWLFVAGTVSQDGVVTFYGGREDGRLHFAAGDGRGASFVSGLPIHIGQDGTGAHGTNFNGKLDEMGFWTRALTVDEIEALYRAGLCHESPFRTNKKKQGGEGK